MSEPDSVKLAKLAIAYERAHAVYFPGPAKEMADLASAVMLNAGIGYWIGPLEDSITCTTCRKTSHNQADIANLYCGFCHKYHQEVRQP